MKVLSKRCFAPRRRSVADDFSLRRSGRHTRRIIAALCAFGFLLPSGLEATNPVTTGLRAEYQFLDGSGTTVLDSSGNSANATFGSPAPSWTTWGVNFNPSAGAAAQTITLPSAVNNWMTAVFYVCPKVGPQSTSSSGPAETWSQYQVLMGSTNYTGANLAAAFMTTASGSGGSAAYDGYLVPQIWNGLNSATTAANDGFGACSTVAYVRDASSDHLYVNGTETGYIRHGGSASYTVTGSYTIGSSGVNQTWSGLMGNLAYAAFWSTALSASDISQVTQYVSTAVQGRTGYPTVTKNTSNTNQLIAAGDSITAGYGSTPWTNYLSLTNTYNVQNWGIGGQNIANIRVMGPVRDMTGASTVAKNTFVIFGGTNDVCIDGYTVPQAWQNIQSAIQQRKALGARVVVVDVLSRNGCDATRDTLNASIRSGWQAAGADAFVDLGASVNLGKDGAYSNTSYFQSDGTHMSNTGASLIGDFVSNAVNYLDGSTSANPTVVSTSTYSAKWSTAYMQPSGNTAITLPDCQGMTGQPIQILNSGFTVTAVGSNSQTINGSTSPYTVATSGLTQFTPSFNGSTTAGCSWTSSGTSSSIPVMASSSLATATTIAPTTPIVNLTGGTTITTMVPPSGVGSSGTGACIYLIPGATVATTASGNFQAAYTLNANTLYISCWNGSKWYVK
jgi:trimeric autotransporter adhesin